MMPEPLFRKILVANRSEIAVRIINACRTLRIPTVAVYSEADANSKHRMHADEAVLIGPPPPGQSYLNMDKIIEAAKQTGCDAIHPGYGFLAENPLFSKRCADEKLTFIGPSADAIELMGNKVASRLKMADAGIPLIPGMKGNGTSTKMFEDEAGKVGYPVMIKAAAGGGGKGMRIVNSLEELPSALEAAQREAKNAFGDDSVYLEKYIANPRHVEFQVLADKHGNCIHLFERECSIQRRHQKIIEETPSVALNDDLRRRMGEAAVNVTVAAAYTNAGTVEFLVDEDSKFYFLEMNTRIQVEHPITELVCGVDLVVEQIRIAAGLPLSEGLSNLTQRGHAIECRIYAEDGENNFMPSIGKIISYSEPVGPGIRVDSGVRQGTEITIDYDQIMAKLIDHAPDRQTAIARMIDALHQYKILGVRTSKKFMVDVLQHTEFAEGRTFTNFIEKNMSAREACGAVYGSLATAVVAAASQSRSMTTTYAGYSAPVMPSPWESLGSWQIGDFIHG